MDTLNLSQIWRTAGPFIDEVEERSGQRVRSCYQCGKCTAGCPVAYAMEHVPREIMRMIQVGLKDEVLMSSTIWLCASCVTCTARCPKNIDLARVMDTLRIMCKEGRYPLKERGVSIFNEIFLNNVKKLGRSHELNLILRYNMAVGKPLKDADKGPIMLSQGKLPLLPKGIKDRRSIRAIFRRSLQEGGEGE